MSTEKGFKDQLTAQWMFLFSKRGVKRFQPSAFKLKHKFTYTENILDSIELSKQIRNIEGISKTQFSLAILEL